MGRDKRQLEYPAFDSLFHRQLSLLENCFPRVWVSVQTFLPFSIPHRIVVGDRSLEKGMLEYQGRRDNNSQAIAVDGVIEFISQSIT